MACPFFFPTERMPGSVWSHPARLPLGAGFCGLCRAGGVEVRPCEAELRDFCNLGYAADCPHMPGERHADCVRFAVAKDDGDRIALYYAYEREHAPVKWGTVAYDLRTEQWAWSISDVCVQRQAECFLAVAKDDGDRIALYYVYEREHAPVKWGTVAYDLRTEQWAWSISDVCVQRQAECFLAVYLEKRPR